MKALIATLILIFSIYSTTANAATPEEQYQTAVEYWQTPDQYGTAIELWKENSIENNHIPSMWALVIAYTQGIKVEYNITKVIKWLTRLSDLDHADAKEMLGDLYYYGRGVPQDYEMAYNWYTNYIEFEQDSDILIRYATLIATGQGTTKNLIKAWQLLRKASSDKRYSISGYILARMVYINMNVFEQFQIQNFIRQQIP